MKLIVSANGETFGLNMLKWGACAGWSPKLPSMLPWQECQLMFLCKSRRSFSCVPILGRSDLPMIDQIFIWLPGRWSILCTHVMTSLVFSHSVVIHHCHPLWSSVMIAKKLSMYVSLLNRLHLLVLLTSYCGSILG